MAILHEDPYRLTEVDGVGFARADKIALAGDVPPESDRRAQAAAVFALAEAEQQGNSYLPLEELAGRTAKLIGLDARPGGPGRGARGWCSTRDRVYRERTHASEVAVAATMRTRAAASARPSTTSPARHAAGEDGLTAEQWAAVHAAFTSRITVLTGGPGVGKTVCTAAIVAEAEARQRLDRALRADRPRRPAARGGDRARGADDPPDARSGCRAGSPPTGRRTRCRPTWSIVDESSMLNLRLMEVLLGGLAESTHIVFVGDADQLPPIGAGKPFDDLIASGVGAGGAAEPDLPPGGALDDHHRGPRDQPGPAAPPRAARDQERDFFFIDRPDPERALETVVEVVAERAPGRFGVDPIRDVQVLAPMYRGAVGIDALNERLAGQLNPDGQRALNDRFRIGDRLIQTRNSHDLGLMNGSIVFLRRTIPRRRRSSSTPRTAAAGDSLRGDRDAAARLRDLGPQGPGLRGPGRRRRLPPLARADADPAAALHRDHPRAPDLRGGRRPGALAMAVRRDEGGGRHSGLAQRLRS